MELDDIDFTILSLLQQDGRISHTAIAKLVELSSPSVTARIQRLEKDGTIVRYAALLAPDRIDQGILGFVRVRTGASDDDSLAFEQYAQRAPEVLECHDVDGEDSYILKVRTRNTQALRELIARIRSFPDVTRTITSIVLLTIREEALTSPIRQRDVSVSAPPSPESKENDTNHDE